MYLLVGLLILAVLAVPLAIAIQRSTELFVLQVERGEVKLRRGRIPPRLLGDIEEVVQRPPLKRGEIRVVVSGGRPRVEPTPGIGKARLQRLRNVVGQWDPAQIRAGRKRR